MTWTALAPPLTPSVLFCPSGLASLSVTDLLGHSCAHSGVHSFITCLLGLYYEAVPVLNTVLQE